MTDRSNKKIFDRESPRRQRNSIKKQDRDSRWETPDSKKSSGIRDHRTQPLAIQKNSTWKSSEEPQIQKTYNRDNVWGTPDLKKSSGIRDHRTQPLAIQKNSTWKSSEEPQIQKMYNRDKVWGTPDSKKLSKNYNFFESGTYSPVGHEGRVVTI